MHVMRKAKEAMAPGNIFGAGNGVFGETDCPFVPDGLFLRANFDIEDFLCMQIK